MSNGANDAVSIQLRNLEEESDKEDGNGREVKEIRNARDEAKTAKYWWYTFFIMLCAFAVLIDPLFCYIYVIEREKMCISYDQKLASTFIGLRIAIDVFYFIDIIIFFGPCCSKPRTDRKSTVIPLKKVIKRPCFQLLLRILVALPIPEVTILSSEAYGVYFDPINAIFILIAFQYTLRIFLIYQLRRRLSIIETTTRRWILRRWLSIIETTTRRWIKAILDFLPFILASHLFGAFWYSLAIQRQVYCWKLHNLQGDSYKYSKNFSCPLDQTVNITRLQELCPTDSEDKNGFDFGIYLYALQSNSTSSSNLPGRILQSFWWALRNLSSFGSNLQTSMDTTEIFFSIGISISGMALFLVYLNARVKESQERSAQRKLKEKKHLMITDLDLWLSKNVFKLKTMTKDSKVLKTRTVIIENMHKLEETQAIDVQNIIFILPIKYKKSIKRLLCLASLRKVPMLANLNEKMLKVICEHLKPIIYIEDNYIVQEGKPLGMMLFITQGIAYTIGNNDGVGTSCGSSSNKWLKRGDYYGEELLNWAFKCPFYSDLPISTITVLSQQKVEAFALRASDLKSIVSIYWWHFTRNLPQVQLEQWENLAASTIQAACRRAKRLNGWDKFTVEN